MLSGVPLTVTQVPVTGGTELVIAGTAGNDHIRITQSEAGITVRNTGGWTTTVSGSFTSIVVHGKGGADKITIDPSVTEDAVVYGGSGADTLVAGSGNDSIYGGGGSNSLVGGSGNDTLVSVSDDQDTLTGGSGFNSFWANSSDTVTGVSSAERSARAVHTVGTMMTLTGSGGSTSTVQESATSATPPVNPTTTDPSIGYSDFSSDPLFAPGGPTADDVQQGDVGDCYFLATLSSIAKVDPQRIEQSIVRLSDGTYLVQFDQGNTPQYVHIDGELPTWTSGGGLAYANLGQDSSTWVALIEKAFTIFRNGAGTYDSISRGWMDEVYSDFGSTSQSNFSAASSSQLMSMLQSDLAAGESVTYGVFTAPSGVPVVSDHAYMVDRVNLDTNGNVVSVRLRNPWGTGGNDGSTTGYVTLTPAQAYAAFGGMVAAQV